MSTPLGTNAFGFYNFVKVSGGMLHTCALDAQGSAWCWGAGAGFQLGVNSSITSSNVPMLVSGGLVYEDISAGSDHVRMCRQERG